MRKYLLFFLFLIFAIPSQSQNLVPNGDFEQYINCPQNGGQVDSCLYWINPTMGSPDYFNTCSDQWCVDVPFNSFGFQNPKSGNAFCGVILYFYDPPFTFNWREYIEVPLKSALEANVCYHLSFYVSLAEISKYSCSDIGAYFSDNLLTDNSSYLPLTVTPQFNNTLTNLTDTAHWTLIEGDYQAHGGESFLIIGNFKDDTSTAVSIFNTAINVYPEAYLYIDNVSVYKCNTPVNANAGSDKNMCQGESALLEMQYFPDNKYKWYTLDSVLVDSTHAVTVTPDSTTRYALWIKNFLYTESYDTVTVFVEYDCYTENVITIPNVFTPNNDGFNDNFFTTGENITGFTMVVYNRWGKKMFETNELSPGWDGNQNGTPCDAGVYFYVADVRFKNGQTASKNGSVTLVR